MEDNNASKISCYNNNSTCSSNSSRQSSTRWSPTSEQIRILKDLYYNNGVRSPTAEQIQRISAKLRQFGKIEGKNVFYWFQNHKARERQKKRFTTTTPPPPPPHLPNYNRYHHHQQQQPDHHIYYNKFTPAAAGGFLNYGYGSVEIGQQNHPGWTGFHHDPYSYPYSDQTLEMQMEGGEGETEAEGEERETLPLFPIHGDAIRQQASDYGYNSNNYFNATSSSRASLELSLSSSYSFSRFHTTIN